MTRPNFARIVIGLALLVAWPNPGRITRIAGIPYPHGLSAIVDLSILVQPVVVAVMTGAYVLAVIGFVLRIRPGATGVTAACLLALVMHLTESQWPRGIGLHNGAILPGGTLTAYLIAWFVTRKRSIAEREWFGVEAACGIVAAGYSLAGLSKVLGSGFGWAQGANLSIHIATHSHSGAAFMRPLRLSVAENLQLCTVLGIGTLLVECSFLAFTWQKARKPYAILVTCMHTSISILMGLHHFDWLFTAIGFAWASSPRPVVDER